MICVSLKLDDKIRRSSNHMRNHWRLFKDIKKHFFFFFNTSKSCRYSRWRKTKLENMRLRRNSSSLLCQKKRTCSQVSDLTAVVTHFLQSKISWSTSSSSTDGLIHPMRTMISRDIWSDASRCHRINLHDTSQGFNHMTFFINVKIDPHRGGRSSCTEYFPNTLIWSKILCPEVARTWS